jgi:hypothetical protein
MTATEVRRIDAARTTPAFLSGTAVAMVLGLSLVRGLSPFWEPDLWWQLRTGDGLRDGAGLTTTDPSAPFADRAYTATQWLPEWVASWVHSWGGVAAVLWLRAVAVLVLTLLVYVIARRYAGRLPSAVATGVALIAAGGGLNPRPQLVSFVLFAVVLHAWLGMMADRRPRWWLVPVFWVWACCHGLWPLGLALGALLLLTASLDPGTRPPRRQLLQLSALWGACAVAVALTPLGPRLLTTPFQVAGNASMIADEWRPTPLNNVFAWAALLELLLVVWLWARRPGVRPWWQLALLAFAAFCTLWMWRLVPLGAIAVTPLLAMAVQERLTARRESFGRRERSRLVVATVALAAVGALVCAGPSGSGAARYPGDLARVDTALDALPVRTVVLADFGISGWLLWRHPDLAPVADLRGEIYSPEHLTAYRQALTVQPGWQDFVRDTGARAALVEEDAALGDALRARLGWTVTARDGDFVLLEPAP